MAGGRKNAFEVKWRIENVTSWLQTRDDTLYSPQFLVEPVMNTRWILSLSTKWKLGKKYLSLAIQRDVEDNGPELMPLNYELSFLACDGSLIKSKSCHKKFTLETVSHELNVKLVDILHDEKEVYLPEGVLTVCCKLWRVLSSVSLGGLCSIRSVIGTKCVTLEAAIHNYSQLNLSSKMTVYFMSPSLEINFISFNLSLSQSGVFWWINFKRINIDCKRFSHSLLLSSCHLYVLNNDGSKTKCLQDYKHISLATLMSSNEECTFQFRMVTYYNPTFLKNDILTLLIEARYYPGVELELIDYDVINYEKKTLKSEDVLNVSNPERLDSNRSDCLYLLGHEDKLCDIEKKWTSDDEECLDAAGRGLLPTTTLKEDLSSLCNDRLFCDTKLQTDTETFPAHRSVLSARSPVFKKMFTTDMKEKAGECINIPDISSDTVRHMLQFIYTDSTVDLEMQNAKDLYIAADKYDIASLKHRCSSFMKKNLCPSNVCEVFVLADMHQDKDLESAAHEYACNYDEEVFGSDEWKRFMQNYSSLAARVLYLKWMKK